MKLSTVLLVAASAAVGMLLPTATTNALSIQSSEVAPPDDVRGEHQTLERTWRITSDKDQIEKLLVLIPGPVFVELDSSLQPKAAPAPEPETEAPTETPVVSPEPTPAATTPTVYSSSESASDEGYYGYEASSSGEVVVVKGSNGGEETSSASDDVLIISGSNEAASSTDSGVPDSTYTSSGSEETEGTEESTYDDDSNDEKSPEPTGSIDRYGYNSEEGFLGSHDGREVEEISVEDTLSLSKKKDLIATIVITGNSSDFIDLIEVVETDSNGIKLHFKNKDAVVEGYVLTHIYLFDKHTLRSIATEISGDVVIGDGVLVHDDDSVNVDISTAGIGNIYITETNDVSLKSLSVDVAGTGKVQLQFPSLELRKDLDVAISGTGSVAVLAASNFEADELNGAVAGIGSFFVESNKIDLYAIDFKLAGAGTVSLASAGLVTKENLEISGSGKFYAGYVAAKFADVSVSGSADVIVQVSEKLVASAGITGEVKYINARPKTIKTKVGWWFWRTAESVVHPAEANTVVPYTAVPAPDQYPLYYLLATEKTKHYDDPRVTIVPEPVNFVSLMSAHLNTVAHGPNAWLMLASVAAGLAIIVVAVQKVRQVRMRRHYRPLV